MSNLTKRLEAVEAALAKQSGDSCFKVITIEDGETHAQARERAALTNWPGEIVFMTFTDTKA